MTEPKPTCRSCRHPHLFRDECNFQIPSPEWDPPFYPCRCTQGTSRASLDKRPGRRAIPSRVLSAVLLRDGFVCTLCGCNVYQGARAKRWPRRKLTLDHIVHYSAGGLDTVENLRVACASCNSRRGAGELPGWPLAVMQVVARTRATS